MRILYLCWLGGHEWDYEFLEGRRICEYCEKIEVIPK